MKSDTQMDSLKEHYNYKMWHGRNTLPENLFIWRFFLSGNEFPTWTAHKIKTSRVEQWPPSIKSIWKQPDADPDLLLRVNIFECISRDAAHNFLLQLLGEFQSHLEIMKDETSVGDVAFTVPSRISVVAARANLVFHIARVDRDPKPVEEIARKFDLNLIRKEMGDVKVVPEFTRFEVEMKELPVDTLTPLIVEASDPIGRPLWFKFFSQLGEVCMDKKHLVYRPAESGPQEITALAINADGGMAHRTLKLYALGKGGV